MKYRVVAAMNHNVVLACDEKTQEQIVLMAKGIGFGKKAGDTVSDDGTDRQIFKLCTNDAAVQPIQTDHAAVEKLVRDVVSLAKERLEVDNPRLYDALLDHIQFAIERIQFGLPIENPFIHEIALLYTREYEVASAAVQMIQSRLQVNMGDAEIGFIALHLHSAGKDKSMDRSVNSVQLYKEVMQLLEQQSAGCASSRQVFLQTLLGMLDTIRHGVRFHFPFPLENEPCLTASMELARKIDRCIQTTCRLSLDEHAMRFLVLDLERLLQSIH